jgi:hypothetical protein
VGGGQRCRRCLGRCSRGQMQLKMAEVLVAEQKRCLGCGHQYVA